MRIKDPSFYCNRHPRLCKGWVDQVFPKYQTFLRRWSAGLPPNRSVSALQCLALNKAVTKPYRIDRRRNLQKHIRRLVDCLASTPSGSTVRLAHMADRVRFWETSWLKVEHILAPLPTHISKLEGEDVASIFRVIGNIFWAGSIQRLLADMNWTINFGIENKCTPYKRTLSVHIDVMPNRKWISFILCLGPRPTYPRTVEGVRVSNWKQHVYRLVAREMARVVVLMKDQETVFHLLNHWVYGHFDRPEDDSIRIHSNAIEV